jgi:protein phosphatase
MNEPKHLDTSEYPVVENFLGRHFGPSPPPVRVTLGAQSHQGLVRDNNEDHYAVVQCRRSRSVLLTNMPRGLLPPADDVSYVLTVADGMGGAAVGELASMLALRSAWDQGPSAIKWTWIINDREVEELRQKFEIMFRRMDQVLLDVGKAGPGYAGMGTTLTGAYTVGPHAFIGHVGDSRAYLYRAARLTQLTRDQTLAQDCLDAGLPVPSRSWYHRLTNCLGGPGKDLDVEFHHVSLENDDQLLLCTDGLTDMVPDEQIAVVLGKRTTPAEKVHTLVDMALERGGKDNITVVLAQYNL